MCKYEYVIYWTEIAVQKKNIFAKVWTKQPGRTQSYFFLKKFNKSRRLSIFRGWTEYEWTFKTLEYFKYPV